MKTYVKGVVLERLAHEKSVKEDHGSCNGDLWSAYGGNGQCWYKSFEAGIGMAAEKNLQFQSHANRLYEITAFGSVFSFPLKTESINGYRRGMGQGLLSVIPLLLRVTLE